MNSHNPKSSLFQPIDQSLAKYEFIFVFSLIYLCLFSFLPLKMSELFFIRMDSNSGKGMEAGWKISPEVTCGHWTNFYLKFGSKNKTDEAILHQEIINCFITYKMKHSGKSTICLPN